MALISDWFTMDENQTSAIRKMEHDGAAIEFVRAGMRLNVARTKRYKLLENGNEDGEHIPTQEELKEMKEAVHKASEKFKRYQTKKEKA